MHRIRFGRLALFLFACLILAVSQVNAVDAPATYSVGVAQADITPDYPVRLSGFGFRRTESEGVTMPIWAKALAISVHPDSEPVILITVDNVGIPASMSEEVAKRLATKVALKRPRLAIASSHTHTGPMLRAVLPTLFGGPISDEQWSHIDRYGAELTDKLEQVALAALNDRKPSRLSLGIGSSRFAINRRTKGGPIDHDLPLLAVRGLDGTLRAVCVNYACHCVTLSNNKISGDWAGYAQDLIQREFPTAIAMVSIGCGADQNPSSGVTGDKTDVALGQGAEIAAEVKRLLSGFLAPINGDIDVAWTPLSLAFAEPPSRAQFEERAKKSDYQGYHARVQLERLDRGETLQSKLDYPVASWSFGDSLAMVFLPGEVVVDYSLRLKKELDGRRLWVNAYSNDVPCYIPSERILGEGGYEAAGAMTYYDRPGPLKAGLEAEIIGAVHQQLDAKFLPPFDPKKTQGSLPKSPQQSLAMLQATPNLRIDLVAAEPLISDPVAIDFGADGSFWVAEMLDYPTGDQPGHDGTDGKPALFGQVRLVRDRDGDGQYDSSTVFLDKIPFPTGVTAWRNGVLVCSAPDILFAEDTDGDDKADVVKKLYSGFGTLNHQARVNSLVYGMDGWIHGSCGLFGGTITNFKGETYQLGDRDFRIRPETGEIEAATGRTQQGRVRDDFGNWFGCDNSNLAYHYPLAEHYLKRNPNIASPTSRVNLAQSAESRQLFPARTDAQRFQLSGAPGTVTAACGLGIYRDNQLGAEYTGNLFVCEPVNLLVHRMVLKPKGSSYLVERAANETQTEFLRSSDGWFRPVQAITAPDGSLWVVDMYRFVIEDPRWIPEHDVALLDVRAGSSLGRIYRVRNEAYHAPPAMRPAGAEASPKLGLSSSFATERRIQQFSDHASSLVTVNCKDDVALEKSEAPKSDPITRIRRLRLLDAESKIVASDVMNAIKDPHPGVRAYGLVLAEKHVPKDALPGPVVEAATDADAHVRLQAACSLGQWDRPELGTVLAKMALKDAADPYIVAAVFSSVTPRTLRDFTATLFNDLAGRKPPSPLMIPFLATAVGYSDDVAIKLALTAVSPKTNEKPKSWQLNAVANLVESLSQRRKPDSIDPEVMSVIRRTESQARELAIDESLDDGTRLEAINLLGRDPVKLELDASSLGQLLSSVNSPIIQVAAIESLERMAVESVPATLASHFRELSPTAQERAIDALLSRDAWLDRLLSEIKHGTIPPTSITAAQRQELVGHPNAVIRERATALLASTFNADRQQVIKQYGSALELTGSVDRGKEIFKKTCSQCHRLGDIGKAVGPNLAMVANKTPAFMLQELLDPNRNVDTRYTSYVAVTKGGLIRTGILSSESSTSVTLTGPEGKQFTLLRRDLDELRGSGKSLMPEGLEKDLSCQAVADVISFLGSVPVAPKQFAGNTPLVVRPSLGRVTLAATTAAIFGEQIMFEQPFRNIGYWHGLQDHVVWNVELPDAHEFDVYLDYACDSGAAGNHYLIEAGSDTLSGHTQSTGGWDRYTVSKIGTVALATGSHRIVVRPDGAAIRGALFDLRAVHLIPKGEALAQAQQNGPSKSTDIGDVARRILDDKSPEPMREALIAQYPDHASELVIAMTKDLPDNPKEEYRRIPWIWRVAVACGKRDKVEQLRSLLEVSVPKLDQPLKDWQAVVIGGGAINGIGLKGAWPRSRIDEVLLNHEDLTKRWKNLLVLAARMADNEKTPTGTRYDALRIIALDDGDRCRDQLAKYLAKGTHEELRMGAISGLSDIDADVVPKLLLEQLAEFPPENRGLAVAALLRTEARSGALLNAIADGRISSTLLSSPQRKMLRDSKSSAIRDKAAKVLPSND